MRFAYEYIKKILETTSLTAPVVSVSVSDEKTTIEVLELQHITVGRVVEIDGVKKSVIAVDFDNVTFTVDGEFLEPSIITYPPINFVHGTAMMVNAEIKNGKESVSDKDILAGNDKCVFPILWMVEIYQQRKGGKTDNFDIESDVKLVFLDGIKKGNYDTDGHYENVINGQNDLWRWFYTILLKHKTIVKTENHNVSNDIYETAHTNFGRFEGDKGHTSQILDKQVSGLEVSLKKVQFVEHSCLQNFETKRCVPITIYQTIMAGGVQIINLLSELETKSVDDSVYFVVEKKRFYVSVSDGSAYGVDGDYIINTSDGGDTRWTWIDIASKSNGFFIADSTIIRDALPYSLRRKGHVCNLYVVDKYVLYSYQGGDGQDINWQNAANWELMQGGGGGDQVIESAAYQNFNQTPTITPKTGDLFHNVTEKTLSYQLADGGSAEICKEVFDYCVNIDSMPLTDGMPVSIVSVSGNRCAIKRTDPSNEKSAKAYAGLVTVPTIAVNEAGRVAKIGTVKKINTSGLTEGLDVYVTVIGQLGNIVPTSPNFKIRVGTTEVSHSVNGQINLLPQITEPCYDKEKTGFVFPELATVTGNATNRTVTLTGTPLALVCGNQITELVDGWTSPAHGSDITKSYYLYHDGTNFIWDENSWLFYYVQIAKAIYINGGWSYIRETHGLMPWTVHKELHERLKAYITKNTGLVTGFVLNSTTAVNRRPVVSAATINDEDLATINAAITTNSYTRCWLTGTGDGVANFAVASPEIAALSGNNPYYNQYTGGAWQQTLLSNNQHSCIWIIAMPMAADTESQKYRFLFMQGQSVGTLAEMVAKNQSDLNINALKIANEEVVVYAKIIIKYAATNWTIANPVTYYNTTDSPSDGTTSLSGLAPVALSGLHSDTTGENDDPNFQHLTSEEKSESVYKLNLNFASDLTTNDFARVWRTYNYSIDSIPSGFVVKYESDGTNYTAGVTVTAGVVLLIYPTVLPSQCTLVFTRK